MFLYWLWWVLLLTGLITSGTFLVLHRPRLWFRPAALNASGWVIIIFLLYGRSSWLWLKNGSEQIHHLRPGEVFFSLVFATAIDVLLIIRVYTFLRFQKTQQPTLNWHERSFKNEV